MTTITFYQDEKGEILGFRSEGHAGYADSGEDIYCSAISALLFNAINSIDILTDDELDVDVDEDEAVIDACFYGASSDNSQLLMQSLLIGLANIADDDEKGKYIRLIFEEVREC